MEKDKIKAHCNKCSGARWHEVLYKEESEWQEDVDGQYLYGGGDTYVMIKCCGCENIALKHDSWDATDYDDDGNAIVHTTYYPPATYRNKPRWLSGLLLSFDFNINTSEDLINDLICEIYVALQNDSTRLAVMGVRALIEHVMIDKVGDIGTFKENLNEFEKKGFISKLQKEILEPVLDAGHATIHRSYNPSVSDVGSLIDITENIIESLYVNERRAQRLKGKIPPRPPKEKKQPDV